jgi:hypothetical protein
MAKRVFKTDLSVKGIEQLKKDLLNYKNNILEQKIREYVSKLLDIGIIVAKANIDESPLGKYVTLSSTISADKTGCKGIIIAKGEIKEEVDNNGNPYPPFSTILAIEFGAGIYHNETPNPNADKFGLGVGTFPGQTHAYQNTWFYWDEDEQLWKPTHGVKATMPMYNAQMAIMEQMVKVAKTIF